MNMTLERIKQKLISSDKFVDCQAATYIADTYVFKQNIKDFISAFRRHYHNFSIGYSFKTNYCGDFLRAASDLGCYAEVVSPMEWRMAINKGFSLSKIIYNGVIPDKRHKILTAQRGGLVFVDNIGELRSLGSIPSIGLRLSFDIGNNFCSRFGFDADGESSQLKEAVNYCKQKGIKINAIHCHISFARSLAYFQKRIDKMIGFAKDLNVDVVDIGGNMYGRVDPIVQAQIEKEEPLPAYSEYANVIAGTFKERFPDEDKLLIAECGTPVVGNAMSLLAKVIAVKKIAGKDTAILNVTNHDVGWLCCNKDAPIYTIDGGDEYKNIRIFGCSCVEKDVISSAFSGRLKVGGRVLVTNVGAYGLNLSCNFIKKKPKIIVI